VPSCRTGFSGGADYSALKVRGYIVSSSGLARCRTDIYMSTVDSTHRDTEKKVISRTDTYLSTVDSTHRNKEIKVISRADINLDTNKPHIDTEDKEDKV
jgi:hypothetical protein